MNIGFIGLGNLGLPCALAIEQFGGHRVLASDCRPEALEPLRTGRFGRIEPQVEALLGKTAIRVCPVEAIATECDIVFVAVQTPHHPRFEGITPLTEERLDFDYSYLKTAVSAIADAARNRKTPLVVNVVSTVLPGTMRREVEPLLGDKCQLSYNPFFIAMGTTIADFMTPEFVLIGSRDPHVADVMQAFYQTLHDRPCYCTGVESAELIKVSYNTFIGLKLAFVNCLMEVCDKVDADVDQVTDALCLATTRLISPRYMRAGMGDGGGCHPRDNIAMSWLARELGLSYDLFEAAMLSRQGHTQWLVEEIRRMAAEQQLPVVILGTAYKANSDLSTGSPSLLLIELLAAAGVCATAIDPFVHPEDDCNFAQPGLFFVATDHEIFRSMTVPEGSIVVDPWGTQLARSGVQLVRPGRQRSSDR